MSSYVDSSSGVLVSHIPGSEFVSCKFYYRGCESVVYERSVRTSVLERWVEMKHLENEVVKSIVYDEETCAAQSAQCREVWIGKDSVSLSLRNEEVLR